MGLNGAHGRSKQQLAFLFLISFTLQHHLQIPHFGDTTKRAGLLKLTSTRAPPTIKDRTASKHANHQSSVLANGTTKTDSKLCFFVSLDTLVAKNELDIHIHRRASECNVTVMMMMMMMMSQMFKSIRIGSIHRVPTTQTPVRSRKS